MFILKKGHQPGVYVPLRALFLVCPLPTFFLLFLKSSYYSYFFAVKCQNNDWSKEKPR